MILNTCSICIEDIYLAKKTEQDFFILPCKHIFHKRCILQWFGTISVFECPNCRTLINENLIKSEEKIKNCLFKSLKWYSKYRELQQLSDGRYLEFLIEHFENKKLEKYFKYLVFKQLIPNKNIYNTYVNFCILFKNNKALELLVEYKPLQYIEFENS
jgi:hypothetical protein